MAGRLIFRATDVATVGVSLALAVWLVARPSATLNELALVTILGAPLGVWLVMNPFGNRWLRALGPVVYVAAVAPAMFGWVGLLYLPGLVGVLAGQRWR